MAGEQVNDFLLATAFPGLALKLEPEALKYAGGNVIIKLSDKLEDQLLLPEDLLAAASPRFRLRFRQRTFGGARDVHTPGAMALLTVWNYHLAHIDVTLCLTDEADSSPRAGNVDGFAESRGPIDLSITAHKMLFSLVCKQPATVDFECPDLERLLVIEVVAMAEYWELLPSIARELTEMLLSTHGFWESVMKKPTHYLELSMRLRAGEIFADALRHWVAVLAPGECCRAHLLSSVPIEVRSTVLRRAYQLQERTKTLERELRGLALYNYQANWWMETKRRRGVKARTTWLAARPGVNKTLQQKCQWLAKSIFREFLDLSFHGVDHWSHVKFQENGKKDGDVVAGSWNKAISTIRAASKNPESIDVFGQQIAAKYATIFHLKDRRGSYQTSATHITEQLKALVRNAQRSIDYWFPETNGYLNHSDWESWSHARRQGSCDREYCTFLPVGEHDCPWHGEERWEDQSVLEHRPIYDDPSVPGYESASKGVSTPQHEPSNDQVRGLEGGSANDKTDVPGYERASDEWLRVVGLL